MEEARILALHHAGPCEDDPTPAPAALQAAVTHAAGGPALNKGDGKALALARTAVAGFPIWRATLANPQPW